MPSASAGSGYLAQPETTILSGLEGSTTYHYRLVASNGGGSSFGEDQTFTTPAAAPAVGCTPSSDVVTQTTATLAGTVNAESQPTTYQFEYVDAKIQSGSAGSIQRGARETRKRAPVRAPAPSRESATQRRPGAQHALSLPAGRHERERDDRGTRPDVHDPAKLRRCHSRRAVEPDRYERDAEGLINPQGAYTTYQFEYGDDQRIRSSTP